MSTPGQPGHLSPEVLASTIAAVIERQLSGYLATVRSNVESVREASSAAITSLQHDVARQLQEFAGRLEAQQRASEAFQKSVQAAIGVRLEELDREQQARLAELERMLRGYTTDTADPAEVAALRTHLDTQIDLVQGRLDDLHKAARRFDEQAAAMVQHVNDTTNALTQRMDDGNQALASAVEERLVIVRNALDTVAPAVKRQLDDHSGQIASQLEVAASNLNDRVLQAEGRINERQGAKLLELQAQMSRMNDQVEGAINEMTLTVGRLHVRVTDLDAMVTAMDSRIASVDHGGIDDLKQQLSSAVGEAMLVRIELDRAMADTAARLDAVTVRMAEIEGLLANETDVNAEVQLERLEELERAIAELDPEQLATRTASAPRGLAAPVIPDIDPLPGAGSVDRWTSSTDDLGHLARGEEPTVPRAPALPTLATPDGASGAVPRLPIPTLRSAHDASDEVERPEPGLPARPPAED